jgi:LPS sulfotransferase NodH
LYKATSSSVFQTNIQHQEEAIKKLESLAYD